MNSTTAKRSEMVSLPGPEGDLEGIFSYISKNVTMHNKVVYSLATALNQLGYATVRFNFRGVGRSKGTFNHGIGEQRDLEAVLDHFDRLYPQALKVIGGFSFGAKVGLLAGSRDERVSGLIGVGITIDVADFTFLQSYEKPKLIIQGSQDEYGSVRSLNDWFAKLQEPKKLVIIEDAVHLFDGKLNELKNAILTQFPLLMEAPAFP
jgi:uncharacterized protein